MGAEKKYSINLSLESKKGKGLAKSFSLLACIDEGGGGREPERSQDTKTLSKGGSLVERGK